MLTMQRVSLLKQRKTPGQQSKHKPKSRMHGAPPCCRNSTGVTTLRHLHCAGHQLGTTDSTPAPVPVSFVHEALLLVQLCREAVDALQHCAARAQAHGAAHVLRGDLGHEHNSGVWRAWVELCAVCILDAQHITCKLNHSNLQQGHIGTAKPSQHRGARTHTHRLRMLVMNLHCKI
jgi:hypothetical protein